MNEKIKALEKALNDLGIKTTFDPDCKWYCTDGKQHYGMMLITDIIYDGDTLDFLFTPSGKYINSALEAPIFYEKQESKNEKRRKKK